MIPKVENCGQAMVELDVSDNRGPLEWWRHTVGHGGINHVPLPERVVQGIKKLEPRLIRIFLQEFFHIYATTGEFDWDLLDPYMDTFARTGAKIVASINIKPKALFPTIDHSVWRPSDVGEWQRVIFELVNRYSVEKPIVTYWEVGNETDIGEWGGSPYLIPDPKPYGEFYQMTIEPILKAFPVAKVGGPAACWVENQPLPGLIDYCRENDLQLDFISWHLYNDNPARHAIGVKKAKAFLDKLPGKCPEMLITEWNKNFDSISVEDLAYEPRRAAIVTASILSMLDAGVDWTFYYHIWDQVFYRERFQPFFSEQGIKNMVNHWNRVPHRFGLFGVNEEVRPQYFVYRMLSGLGDERIGACSSDPDVRVLAGRTDARVSILLTNFNLHFSRDSVVTLHYANLPPGCKELTVYRIDQEHRWCTETLELQPLEKREVDTEVEFHCQVYCPADSVVMVVLQPMG